MGIINGVSSSRALQREAERNIEVIWLLSTLTPSYKTIADYRKDYPGQIERVNPQLVRFLIDRGPDRRQTGGADETKLKVYTGWDIPDIPLVPVWPEGWRGLIRALVLKLAH